MASDQAVATVAALSVTASLPFYLYGAWLIVEADPVTWDDLLAHLRYIVVGLALTTTPVVGWMVPRLSEQFGGIAVVHAVVGLHAYAMLAFALTGIVRIFGAKYAADRYRDPDPDADIDDLHENMGAWRWRLRIGVAGYLLLWLLAWLLGVVQYALYYF